MKLLIADAGEGGAKPKLESKDDTIQRLTGELAAANLTIVTFQAEAADRAKTELAITLKMGFGLSRDQAITVIKRQKEHDEAEKQKVEARKAKTI
jgi:hypothetical protein